jgi:exonuclease VII large subunit
MEDFFAILKDAELAYTVQHYPCAIQGNQAKQEVYEQLQQIKNDITE